MARVVLPVARVVLPVAIWANLVTSIFVEKHAEYMSVRYLDKCKKNWAKKMGALAKMAKQFITPELAQDVE